MSIRQQEQVNSIKALCASIETDPQTQRWFTHLVVQTEVRKTLSSTDDAKRLYTALKTILSRQRLLYLILITYLLGIALIKIYWLFAGLILFAILSYKLAQRKKYCVRDLGKHMVLEDYDEDLLNKTSLYQLSEEYSKKYNIPSLVDAVFHSDKILRSTLLAADALVLIIWPIFTNLQVMLLLFLAFQVMNAFLKTTWMYQRLT